MHTSICSKPSPRTGLVCCHNLTWIELSFVFELGQCPIELGMYKDDGIFHHNGANPMTAARQKAPTQGKLMAFPAILTWEVPEAPEKSTIGLPLTFACFAHVGITCVALISSGERNRRWTYQGEHPSNLNFNMARPCSNQTVSVSNVYA